MRVLCIAAALVALLTGAQASAEYVSGNGVNCRELPSASSAVIDKFSRGQEVSVERIESGWVLVADPGCWMHSRFISTDIA